MTHFFDEKVCKMMKIHENSMNFWIFSFLFPENLSGKNISSRQIGPDKYLKVPFDFQFSIPTNEKYSQHLTLK